MYGHGCVLALYLKKLAELALSLTNLVFWLSELAVLILSSYMVLLYTFRNIRPVSHCTLEQACKLSKSNCSIMLLYWKYVYGVTTWPVYTKKMHSQFK